jgi:hypothetical protein
MNLVSVLFLLIAALALMAFGYTLFFRIPQRKGGVKNRGGSGDQDFQGGKAGDPQTCPVCAARLPRGMLVRSAAFPSQNGRDRLMHIIGCPFCLEGAPEQRRPRVCPVCHKPLGDTEHLFARVFERPQKSHVHVLGCINCRGPKAMR